MNADEVLDIIYSIHNRSAALLKLYAIGAEELHPIMHTLVEDIYVDAQEIIEFCVEPK
jgi:hypothetical protein